MENCKHEKTEIKNVDLKGETYVQKLCSGCGIILRSEIKIEKKGGVKK